MFKKLREKLSGAKESSGDQTLSPRSGDDYLHVPNTITNEELIAVQKLLALQARLDEEILFENHCSVHGKSHYIVVSKCSVRLYKSKKHWHNVKKKSSPEVSYMIYDSFAMIPEVPAKNTMQLRTTTSILSIKLQDEDAVDDCIALINTQSVNQTSREARFHFWKGKFTVHIFVSEIWELPLLDNGSASESLLQLRVAPKVTGQTTLRSKVKANEGEDIVYSIRIRDRDRNPVFNDQFTFLCVNRDDEVFVDLFDFDQWGKKELIGLVHIDLLQYVDRNGLHGWFPILDASGNVRPGNGYVHIKLAIVDAADSVDHISLAGSNFFNARALRLQQLTKSIEPVSLSTQKISVFIGTWNVGNEAPPGDISPWIARYNTGVKESTPMLHRTDSMASNGIESPKRNSLEKDPDNFGDDRDLIDTSSTRQLLKTDSADSILSIDDEDFGSLNDLKVRSRKPRNGVKSGQPIGRSKYNRSPIEVTSPPGLYVIGCQECQYTPKNGSNCKDDWLITLSEHLGQDYILVDYSSLWQIRQAIFARSDLFPHISNLSTHKEATGIAHVLGNKGGVVASFRMFQTWMCFVNCHLAAHQTKRDQRNQDIRDIIIKSGAKVGNKQNDLACQFHYIWLLGDLNYRLDYGAQASQKSPALQEFREMECLVQAGRFSVLFNFDQLNRDIQKQEILSQWTEGVYDFPPSFKVERHAGFRYNSARSPAWCDRILWKSFSRENLVNLTSLRICETIATSDHKPISSMFDVTVFHFEESKSFNRGRAELLFTEVTLNLSNATTTANLEQYHLRFRSDCFVQNPIIQALVDKPVRLATPTNNSATGTNFSDESTMMLLMDESWLSAPLFPAIKLKHNNLQRLKQHIISVDLQHFSGNVIAQGVITFHEFDLSEINNLKSTLSASSSFKQQSVPNVSDAVSTDAAAGATLSPSSTSGAASNSNRRVSQMIIRPSSRRESSRNLVSMSESQGRKHTAHVSVSQSSSINRASVLSSETEPSKSRVTSSQLEHFANLQSNTSFVCDLASGTSSLGSLTGTMRLSWAS